MQFTSTARQDVNRNPYADREDAFIDALGATEYAEFDTVRPEDPVPFVNSNGDRFTFFIPGLADFDPRPRYRAPQNPILVALRDAIRDGWDADLTIVSYLDNLDDVEDITDLPEHIDHARKVLTRLANLTKES